MARRVADARARRRVVVAGTIVTAVMGSWRGMPAQICSVDDGTGRITVLFGGVRPVLGIVAGVHLAVEGTAQTEDQALVLWNPTYRFDHAPCEGAVALRLVGRLEPRSATLAGGS